MSVGPPDDTDDLRVGVPIDDSLLALLPLVGRWQGSGVGVEPSSGEQFRFAQQIAVVHDGRPFLAYESRTWVVDDGGRPVRAGEREVGFWRPGAGPDDVELVLATNTGLALVLAGVAGDQVWELRTSSVAQAASAAAIDGERRIYAVRDDELSYATERAEPGADPAPHLNASLTRMRAATAAAEVPRPGRA